MHVLQPHRGSPSRGVSRYRVDDGWVQRRVPRRGAWQCRGRARKYMLLRSSAGRAVTVVVALCMLAAGCASNDDPPKTKPSPTPSGPVEVTFAVYGPEPVIAAYKEIAARYIVA